jgi:DNA-binding NarL/FixJ family response regulator
LLAQGNLHVEAVMTGVQEQFRIITDQHKTDCAAQDSSDPFYDPPSSGSDREATCRISRYFPVIIEILTELTSKSGRSDAAAISACQALLVALREARASESQRMAGEDGLKIRRSGIQPKDLEAVASERASHSESPLTMREQHIVQAISGGLSNKEIARILGIGCETVKSHVSHILIKLDVKNRAQAVTLAHRRGYLKVSTRSVRGKSSQSPANRRPPSSLPPH